MSKVVDLIDKKNEEYVRQQLKKATTPPEIIEEKVIAEPVGVVEKEEKEVEPKVKKIRTPLPKPLITTEELAKQRDRESNKKTCVSTLGPIENIDIPGTRMGQGTIYAESMNSDSSEVKVGESARKMRRKHKKRKSTKSTEDDGSSNTSDEPNSSESEYSQELNGQNPINTISNAWRNLPDITMWIAYSCCMIFLVLFSLWWGVNGAFMAIIVPIAMRVVEETKNQMSGWWKPKKKKMKRLADSIGKGRKKVKLKPTEMLKQNYEIQKKPGKMGRNKAVNIISEVNLYHPVARSDEIEPYEDSSKRPFVKVDINGFSIDALIDTGAALCAIPMDMWKTLTEKGDTPLPFISTDVIAYNYLGESNNFQGMTYLNMSIPGSKGGKAVLQNVPFFIMPSGPDRLIIGQNIMKRHRITIGYEGEKQYIAFKSPGYLKVDVHYDVKLDHSLACIEEVYIEPRQTKEVKVMMEATPRKKSNLDDVPLYVYDNQEENGVIDQVGRLHKGIGTITVHNKEKTTLHIPKEAPIARFDVLTEENSSYVDALGTYGKTQKREKSCICSKEEGEATLLIENEYGQTTMGYEKKPGETEEMPMHYNAQCQVTRLKGGEADSHVYSLKLSEAGEDVTVPIRDDTFHWLNGIKRLLVTYDKPEMITRKISEYLAWLGRKNPGLEIETSPTMYTPEGKECSCSKKRLSSKYSIRVTKNITQLFIYLLLGCKAVQEDWKDKVVGTQMDTFTIGNCPTYGYFSSPTKFSLMMDVGDWGTAAKEDVHELMGQLKPLFPTATINLLATQAKDETEKGLIKNDMIQLLADSEKMPSYWNSLLCEPKERPHWQSEREQRLMMTCTCNKCLKENKPDYLVIASMKWPLGKGEIDLAKWMKQDKKTVFVEAVDTMFRAERARANEESFEVKPDGTDYLEMLGEPLGYDDSWLYSGEYPVKEEKTASNWREVFNMDEVPTEAKEITEKLFDDFESTLSSSKKDYRPIKHLRLSLVPKDPTPFSMTPYPLPPHLAPHMDEIINRMEEQGWCVPGKDPVFVSSSFLVKKNSANFRSPDLTAKNIPYKSSAGTMADKEKTVGGNLANPTAYLEPDEIKEIDKQRGLKTAGQNYRLVIDYSKANVQIGHQLNDNKLITNPLNDCRFSRAKDCKYFSSIDISNAFHSIVFDSSSRKYLHFHAGPGRLKASTVGSLGLAFLPSAFHAIMWQCLRPEVKKYVVLYVDDILVLTEGDAEFHGKVLRMVFEDLQRANLLVNVKKIKVFQQEVEYLGVILDKNGVRILPDRAKQFVNLPLPKTKAQMSGFLGVAAFMASHIPHYSVRAAPLYELVHIGVPFELNDDHVRIIREIAEDIDNAATLSHLDTDRKVYVVVDSSQYGTGGMVAQIVEERVSVIEFFSYKTPSGLENSLSAVEFEMIGLLRVIQSKPVYFHTGLDCVVVTDCRSVLLLTMAAKTTQYGKLNRWVMKLISSQINFELKWVPNTSPFVKMADYLSRAPYEKFFTKHAKEAWNLRDTRELLALKDKTILPPEWEEKETLTIDEIVNYVNGLTSKDLTKGKVEQPGSRHVINDYYAEEDAADIAEIFGNVINRKKQSVYIEEIGSDAERLASDAKGLLPDKQNNAVQYDDDMSFQLANYLTAEQIFEDQMSDSYLRTKIMKLMEHEQKGTKPKGKLRKFRMVNGLLAFKKGKVKPDAEDKEYKIYLPEKSSIMVLAVTHLFGHCSINAMSLRVRNLFYINNLIKKARAMMESCKSCRLYRIPTKRNFLPGHLKKALYFKHIMSMDLQQLPKTTIKHVKYNNVLTITDLWSRMLFSTMVPDQSAESTVKALRELMGTIGAVRSFTSDNGRGLLSAKIVRDECAKFGVREFHLSFAFSPGSHGSVELQNRLFKNLVMKNAEATDKEWPEIFHPTKMQINSLPRRYRTPTENQPDVTPIFISPHELVFGVPSDVSCYELRGFEDFPEERRRLRAVAAKEISDYYKKEQELLDKADEEYVCRFKLLDYVLIRDRPSTEIPNKTTSSKSQVRYKRNIYMITHLYKRRVTAVSLFGENAETEVVSVNDLKRFTMSDYVKELPVSITKHYGEYEPINEEDRRFPNYLNVKQAADPSKTDRQTRSSKRKGDQLLEDVINRRRGESDTDSTQSSDTSEWSDCEELGLPLLYPSLDMTRETREENGLANTRRSRDNSFVKFDSDMFVENDVDMTINPREKSKEESRDDTRGSRNDTAKREETRALTPEVIEQKRKEAVKEILEEANKPNRSYIKRILRSIRKSLSNKSDKANQSIVDKTGNESKKEKKKWNLRKRQKNDGESEAAPRRSKRERKPVERLITEM